MTSAVSRWSMIGAILREGWRCVKSLTGQVAGTVWPTPFLAWAVLNASNPAGHRCYAADHLAEYWADHRLL